LLRPHNFNIVNKFKSMLAFFTFYTAIYMIYDGIFPILITQVQKLVDPRD